MSDVAYIDSATPVDVTSLFLCSFLTRNGGFETGAGREARHSRGSDLQLLACLWIAAGTGSTLGRLESAKPNEGHRVTFRYRFDDGVEDGIKRSSGSGLADICFGRSGFDQFSLIHEHPLSRLRRFDATSVQAFVVWQAISQKPPIAIWGSRFEQNKQRASGVTTYAVHDKVNYQECCFCDLTQGFMAYISGSLLISAS
jgi:hypothetical protein